MAKINVSPDEYASITVAFILDKLLHPDEVIPLNKEFNEYMDKMAGKGMKPLSLNYYLRMPADLRVYYKRIKKVFEYDSNQGMIIYIWPDKDSKREMDKKDGIIKRAIKKLLKHESINTKERQLLMEEIEEDKDNG